MINKELTLHNLFGKYPASSRVELLEHLLAEMQRMELIEGGCAVNQMQVAHMSDAQWEAHMVTLSKLASYHRLVNISSCITNLSDKPK